MKRIIQIDYLKGLAIISVILIHSLTTWQKDLIGGVFYIVQAVPVFLVLVGYNTMLSYLSKGITDLQKCYNKFYLIKRFKKIIIPFTYIFILELVIELLLRQPITIKSSFVTFIIGGWGPGGYFVPLMIQFILIIPLLYKLAQYNRCIMLVISFVINMIFELFSYYTNISNFIYRIVSLRYLFVVALGVYFALYKIKRKKILFAGALCSIIYIAGINYFGLVFPVYETWQSQNIFSFFYPFALVVIGLKMLPSNSKTVIGYVLAKIGEKSYHIFLCQALYFMSLGKITASLKVYIAAPINVLLCVIAGLVFYWIECRLSSYLHLYQAVKKI